MVSKKVPDISKLINEIEDIIEWFESDQVDLNVALEKYEAALKKLEEVHTQLKAAKLKVNQINRKFDV